jgi:hypothetical protein
MRPAVPLIACALLAGCGGGGDRAAVTAPTTAPVSPSDAAVREALRLPERVPLRAAGEAPEDDVTVVRSWLEELSAGEVARAASRFGLPARFQNLGSVALIRTREQAVAVTDSLPCGALMTESGAANGFVVYEARLTDRPGGGCGQGVGGIVRGAVLVRDGHMIEWYRLPDRKRPVIPAGPIV